METIILSADSQNIDICAGALRRGEVVAFATETVYGLGADACNDSAVMRIFAAKNRPADNPLIVHLGSAENICDYALVKTECARRLADAFMPGPITLVLQKKSDSGICKLVTAGLSTVGVRVPKNPVASALLKRFGGGVAAPSANVSGRPSPTTAQQVYEALSGKIPYILDGGSCCVGIESTVVDVTGEVPIVLRRGFITAEDILDVCGSVTVNDGIGAAGEALAKRSPGTRHRHYAPSCAIVLIKNGDAAAVAAALKDISGSAAFIGFDKTYKQLNPAALTSSTGFFSLGKDEADAARNLYSALTRAEKVCAVAVLECAPDTPLGRAVNDRIMRAAGVQA